MELNDVYIIIDDNLFGTDIKIKKILAEQLISFIENKFKIQSSNIYFFSSADSIILNLENKYFYEILLNDTIRNYRSLFKELNYKNTSKISEINKYLNENNINPLLFNKNPIYNKNIENFIFTELTLFIDDIINKEEKKYITKKDIMKKRIELQNKLNRLSNNIKYEEEKFYNILNDFLPSFHVIINKNLLSTILSNYFKSDIFKEINFNINEEINDLSNKINENIDTYLLDKNISVENKIEFIKNFNNQHNYWGLDNVLTSFNIIEDNIISNKKKIIKLSKTKI